jgi:uncharacterized membrane protein
MNLSGRHPEQVARSKYVVALLAVALGVTVALVAPAWSLSPSRYTGWATAVQAFGTVMAFAAATAVFIWQWNESRQRDAAALAEERASQARLVSGWLSVLRSDDGMGDLRVVVRNGSPLPITKVVAAVVDGREMGEVAPEVRVIESMIATFDVVPPSSTVQKFIPNPGGAMGWRPSVQTSFTDAADRHWVRHSNGPLNEESEPLWPRIGIDLGWSWEGVLDDDAIRPA